MCTISFWGMMDGMQAGVAALSTGLLLFGWRRNAAAATFASFFLSASTLLIKPVGVFLIFGHVLAASCLWVWSFRTGSAQGWKRFMVGVLAGGSWCALVMAWCWFSPYFSEANREMGRQALHQLKALALDDSAGSFILLLRSLGVYAIGPVSLLLWAYALLHFRRAVRIHPWSRILLAVTSLVLLLQLAALYLGTHFLTTRYFLPALAIFWIFLSPFLWTLLKESRVACALVLLNALVLSGSIWFPEFSNGWYSKTGYATFHDKQAVATFQLAKSALKKSNTVSEEPFIYILADLNGYHLGLVSRQLIFAGGRQDKVVWPYGPRVWEKHEPVIHPHEISTADFLIMSSDPSEIRSNEGIQKFQIFSDLLQDNASYQTLAEDHGVMIRSVTDPIALEKAMAARLIAEGLLNPQESGPVRLEDSHSAPIAQWESGDELLFAKAEWVDGKLRIITRWSGTRREKRHLAISVALADSSGTQFHWITATLLPPPSFDDGKPYQRTIVDELDCGGFRGKTMAAAVGIYDRSAKTMIPVRSPAPLAGTDRIPVAITNSAP